VRGARAAAPLLEASPLQEFVDTRFAETLHALPGLACGPY
jgi:hypothetical protein